VLATASVETLVSSGYIAVSSISKSATALGMTLQPITCLIAFSFLRFVQTASGTKTVLKSLTSHPTTAEALMVEKTVWIFTFLSLNFTYRNPFLLKKSSIHSETLSSSYGILQVL
jgi:hypothetical protein